MIVLFNVKISNFRYVAYNRPNLRTYDRYDVFRYCLDSYAVFDELVSKYIFYVDMSEYPHKKEELEDYICDLFPHEKVIIHWFRNNTRADWQKACEEINSLNDNLIWFAGNDDHIFLDYNLDCLKANVSALERDPQPFSAMFYSHWFETIRVAVKNNAVLDTSGHFAHFNWGIHDSIRIVRKELWNHYWHNIPLYHLENNCFRTDSIADITNRSLMVKTYIPTRELCRHFDGYSHVGDLYNYGPPLEIPPYYFDKKMKIRYGWTDGYKPDYVNINPAAPNLKTVDPHFGYDCRYTRNRIPLAWQNKIEHFVVKPGLNEQHHFREYKNYIKKSTSIPMGAYLYKITQTDAVPSHWLVHT